MTVEVRLVNHFATPDEPRVETGSEPPPTERLSDRPTSLPVTGAQVAGLVAVALLLVAGGAGLLAVRRRRRA